MTEPTDDRTPVGLRDCVLLRLSAQGKTVSRDHVTDSLGPLFIEPLNLDEDLWGHYLDTVFVELKQDRLVSFASNQVTNWGRNAVCEFLGLNAAPKERWSGLQNRYLIAKALDIHPENEADRKRVGTADGVRVAILVQGHGLSVSPFASMAECLDELVRQELSESTGTTTEFDGVFARDRVLSARLMKGHPGKPERVLPMLLTGATEDSPEALRYEVLRNWIRRLNGVDHSAPTDSAFDLVTFSRQVNHAAGLVEQPRYGESKVFIQHVWDIFRKQSDGSEWTLSEFKQRLVEANRENLLTLSRADLVGAMDQQLIGASEIRLPHATFHFIRLQAD